MAVLFSFPDRPVEVRNNRPWRSAAMPAAAIYSASFKVCFDADPLMGPSREC